MPKTPEYDLVVSGRVVLPERVIDRGYVAVRDGRIAAVGAGETPPARRTTQADRAYILEQGRVVGLGGAEALLADVGVQRAYLGYA